MHLHSVENIGGIRVVPATTKVNVWGQRVVQKAGSEEFITLAELSRTVLKIPESTEGAEKLRNLYHAADLKSSFLGRIFSSIRAFFVSHNLRSKIEHVCQESIECENLHKGKTQDPPCIDKQVVQQTNDILRGINTKEGPALVNSEKAKRKDPSSPGTTKKMQRKRSRVHPEIGKRITARDTDGKRISMIMV